MDDDAGLVVEVKVAELALAFGVEGTVLVRAVVGELLAAFLVVAVVAHPFGVVLAVLVRTGSVRFPLFRLIWGRRLGLFGGVFLFLFYRKF
jgi:hypothetical protein